MLSGFKLSLNSILDDSTTLGFNILLILVGSAIKIPFFQSILYKIYYLESIKIGPFFGPFLALFCLTKTKEFQVKYNKFQNRILKSRTISHYMWA